MTEYRYIVGIDFGTTNTVVSYMDAAVHENIGNTIHPFAVPQLVSQGSVQAMDMLPSVLFLPEAHDVSAEGLRLPWHAENRIAVGEFAQKRGGEIPARMIASAKSWLCHPLVDRNGAILPWQGPEAVSKMSPVEACAGILKHVRDAWNHAFSHEGEDGRLEKQDIYLTVPASFDAVARELTVKAAIDAGLPSVTLLEEPQAAFYSWIESHDEDWRDNVSKGDLVLVCDIGGGTTDFSLIRISEKDGDLDLERIAVGNHLLVGGDNMDLALSYFVAEKFKNKGKKLDASQMKALVYSCRSAKEKLLSDRTITSTPVTVLGKGRFLIGGTLKVDLEADEVNRFLLDGFFPACGKDDGPMKKRAVGLKEMGLSYESDPAITKHLAAFLSRQAGDGDIQLPTAVLFNGGIMKADKVRSTILNLLSQWQREIDPNAPPVREIPSDDFDLSVAKGAAYYGLARSGQGIRIRSGLERTYYLSVESSMPAVPGMPVPLKALCVAPNGMEEGSDAVIDDQEFVLVTGESVSFDIMSSTTRHDDSVGDVIEDWDEGEITDMTSIETTLEGAYGTVIPVTIEISVTEIGTLEFHCVARDGGQRYKLEFNVRERDDFDV